MTDELPFDAEALFNLRDWLRAACEAKGAHIGGAGICLIGAGEADIDIELEGRRFNIVIRPLKGTARPGLKVVRDQG